MTAAELIEQLSKLPPETEMFIWDTDSGDRMDIHGVDFWKDNAIPCADINTVCEEPSQ